ncbi:MAG: serine hydrolase [Anaerolineae bacterium]|nr:serine hydrolase [Anaerolineae bacterium]
MIKHRLRTLIFFALPMLLSVPVLAQAQTIDPRQCAAQTTAPAEVESALDDLLARFIDPQDATAAYFGYAPGAVMLIETPDWRYFKAMGVADIATGAPINCAMPFQIGSNTKTMTAVVLLQLEEEGLLSLDDKLADYLPDYAAALPYGDEMTLRQLATHTSGVFSYTDTAPNGTPGIMEGDIESADSMSRGYTPDELIQFVIDNGEPTFEPGAEGAWAYSNTGYVLLGIIIEQITGKPLADVYQERIFVPLGMNDTFLWNDVPAPDFGLPSSYYQAPFDVEATLWNMSQGWAAGAVISTADDMNTYVRALFAGELFQKPETLARMMDGVPTGSGSFLQYGIGLGEKLPGVWGHGGQTLGYESDLGYVLDEGVSVVVWTNAAKDLAVAGATSVDAVLVAAGVVEDPNAIATEAMAAQLVGVEWHWQQLQVLGENGSSMPVADPARYSIRFNEDGSYNVVADCNRGSGTYTRDGLVLSLQSGPLTRAACPPDSQSDPFIEMLGSVTNFSTNDDELNMALMVDGEVNLMQFTAAGAGENDVAVELVGTTWQWQQLQSMDGTTVTVPNPENYTLLFNDDSSVNLRADCNRGRGVYSLDGSQLAIVVGAMTRAACPPDSLSNDFVQYLGFVASYVLEDDTLYLSLMADGGIMGFSPAGGG